LLKILSPMEFKDFITNGIQNIFNFNGGNLFIIWIMKIHPFQTQKKSMDGSEVLHRIVETF